MADILKLTLIVILIKNCVILRDIITIPQIKVIDFVLVWVWDACIVIFLPAKDGSIEVNNQIIIRYFP